MFQEPSQTLNRVAGNANIEKQFIKGSLDLDDSYDDEDDVIERVKEKAINGKSFPEYEDSDGEEGELVEGRLNSDQKKQLRKDLMAMGYEEEEDDLDEINEGAKPE